MKYPLYIKQSKAENALNTGYKVYLFKPSYIVCVLYVKVCVMYRFSTKVPTPKRIPIPSGREQYIPMRCHQTTKSPKQKNNKISWALIEDIYHGRRFICAFNCGWEYVIWFVRLGGGVLRWDLCMWTRSCIISTHYKNGFNSFYVSCMIQIIT